MIFLVSNIVGFKKQIKSITVIKNNWRLDIKLGLRGTNWLCIDGFWAGFR